MATIALVRSNTWERAVRVLFGFFALAITFLALAGPSFGATISGVRLGENGGKTRLVVDVDREINYSYFLLADPYRIVIDLEEVAWALDDSGQGEGLGLIGDYRYGLFQPGTSRMVLDLKEPAVIERVFFLPPQSGYKYRLVIDLAPVRRDAFLQAVANSSQAIPAYVPAEPAEKIVPKSNQRTVVIDAGHGGVDPGTIGAKGEREKDIVLATAIEVKKTLEDAGYRVLLTRDRDVYIPHRQRFALARDSGADLFISIHADSISDKSIRGATVYTLSETSSDKEAAALAKRENKSDLIAGIDLQGEPQDVTNILVDLAMRETMNYSARFAGYLVPELRKEVLLRKNSHRFAGLLVLKAPDVPSVLLEIGYLSNREDAKQMTSQSGREKIARAITGAVDDYFTSVVASSGR